MGRAHIKQIAIKRMLIMVVAVMVMLWMAALTFKKRELDRVEGAIFLLCYIGYITYLSLNI